MLQVIRKIFKSISRSFAQSKYNDICRGLYIKERTPKTFGTKIRSR